MNTVINIKKLVQTSTFLALRWETPSATPSTGITAVMRGELKAFHRRGVFVAPWQRKMKQAQMAFEAGRVRDTGISFPVFGAPHHGNLVVHVLVAEIPGQAPIIYLAPGSEQNLGDDSLTIFSGSESPYDTPSLRDDSVFFAKAVEGLASIIELPTNCFVWAADWETVPAMASLQRRGHLAVLHTHNIYDAFLGADLAGYSFPGAEHFHHQTVLKAGFRLADVKIAVNRGYCWGLQKEPLYTHIMADHLQDEVKHLVPLDNAAFVELSLEQRRLEEELASDLTKGRVSLEKMKDQARLTLPSAVQEKIKNKAFFVIMGRRVSQKGHDVAVGAIRSLLRNNPKLAALFFFATTHGDETSAVRLQRIVHLAEEFPQNVMYSDGHLNSFNQLIAAADFNVMPSLGEPHGGAFQGCVIPIARAIDGLAAQICAYQPKGLAVVLNDLWHSSTTLRSGLTFREPASVAENQTVAELRQLLLDATPSLGNETFKRMTTSLAETISQALKLTSDEPAVLAQLALGALRAQSARTWEMNLGGVLSLVDAARTNKV